MGAKNSGAGLHHIRGASGARQLGNFANRGTAWGFACRFFLMNTRDAWVGTRAALQAPAWIASDRLAELLVLPVDAPPVPHPEPEGALRATRLMLRLLARLPRSRWRTSCLYESVAECLVLRAHGVPAAVCIGVRRQTDGTPGIAAHAWVARSESDRRFHGFSTMAALGELKAQR